MRNSCISSTQCGFPRERWLVCRTDKLGACIQAPYQTPAPTEVPGLRTLAALGQWWWSRMWAGSVRILQLC